MGHFDIIVNATLQDTDNPQMYVRSNELSQLRKGTLIVDVSCDEGMGFGICQTHLISKNLHSGQVKRTQYSILCSGSLSNIPLRFCHIFY